MYVIYKLVILVALKMISLFVSQIQDEFYRITRVHSTVYSLLNLFQSKGGVMGLRLKAVLLKVIH